MKFGTFHLMELPNTKTEPQVFDEHLQQIKLADSVGFDAVWLTEHHFSSKPYAPEVMGEYGICPSPLAMACAISQVTKNVRIGLAIKILPLEHPVRTAEDAAMADIFSGGRLDFGIGLGYREYEFDGLGIPVEEKLERYQEAMEIILGCWTTDEFSYDGKFWKVPRLTMVPRPVQKPHPPVWVGSRLGKKETIDYAVERGYNLLSAWATFEELRATHERFTEGRAKQGLSDDFPYTCVRHVFVGENDAEAKRDGNEAVEYYFKSTALFRPIGDHERDMMILGSPETCIEKIQELHDEAKINHVICWMNFGGMDNEKVLRSMNLFAEEVIPKFKNGAAGQQAAAQ